jgi:hypothetical protein
MLEAIWTSLKAGVGFMHFTSIMTTLGDLLAHFEDDYVKDQNARNAAIDAIIEILQKEKK